jgi:hypothetical protein
LPLPARTSSQPNAQVSPIDDVARWPNVIDCSCAWEQHGYPAIITLKTPPPAPGYGFSSPLRIQRRFVESVPGDVRGDAGTHSSTHEEAVLRLSE